MKDDRIHIVIYGLLSLLPVTLGVLEIVAALTW